MRERERERVGERKGRAGYENRASWWKGGGAGSEEEGGGKAGERETGKEGDMEIWCAHERGRCAGEVRRGGVRRVRHTLAALTRVLHLFPQIMLNTQPWFASFSTPIDAPFQGNCKACLIYVVHSDLGLL